MKKKKFFYSAVPYRIIAIIVFSIIFQTCIPYLYHVGKEQIRIVLKKEKIENVIHETKDLQIKEKLDFVTQTRIFAIEKLGLNPKGGFVYYIHLDRDEIGWNVSASYPLKLESYQWWFPIVGSVPYKGFFDLEKAKEEEKILIEKGFDTKIRITGGYSTLGWFSDPIFSTQLKTDEFYLAGLIFHEMAHSTIYINGDGVFNESYASFVEEEGLKIFFTSLNKEEILKENEKRKSENKIFSELVKKTANQLNEMYDKNISDAEKLQQKNILIEEFKKSILDNISFSEMNRKKFLERKFNNEDFIGYLRYNSGGRYFRDVFHRCGKDFKKFHIEIEKLKSLTMKERALLIQK
ncbi:MAG: aminopeptidase [Leptospiraceae bacterium]|nr:aminopeptidase [Leptospiraceae bacterium]